jgi:hypothetical protein
MLRRILIVLGTLTALAAALYVGAVAFIAYSLSRQDDYPAFMAELKHPHGPRTYDQKIQAFSALIARSIPIGSKADDAVARMSDGNFTVVIYRPGSAGFNPNAVAMTWKRRAGPCTEHYWIDLQKDETGRVENVAGKLTPFCL